MFSDEIIENRLGNTEFDRMQAMLLRFSREREFIREGDEKMRGRNAPRQVDTMCALILHRHVFWNGPVLILQLRTCQEEQHCVF